eukprot:453630-Rhodomonas_salina.7
MSSLDILYGGPQVEDSSASGEPVDMLKVSCRADCASARTAALYDALLLFMLHAAVHGGTAAVYVHTALVHGGTDAGFVGKGARPSVWPPSAEWVLAVAETVCVTMLCASDGTWQCMRAERWAALRE